MIKCYESSSESEDEFDCIVGALSAIKEKEDEPKVNGFITNVIENYSLSQVLMQ